MATSSRFADLSRQEIAGLVEEKYSKNTQLATNAALPTLKAFCGEKYPDKDQDFDEISSCGLLSQYKEKTGGNYKKKALTSIRFGLQRYFILKRGFNIIADDAFKQSNQVFEATRVCQSRPS